MSKVSGVIDRAMVYQHYPQHFGVGEVLSRRMVAERVGCSYSNAAYHLERAVSNGLLNKQYGFAQANQPGWVYALPETMPRLGDM